MSSPDDAARVAAAIEHTQLKPEAPPSAIDRLCEEAVAHRFLGVCVNPTFVKRAAANVSESDVLVVSVVGFPLGASTPAAVAFEAERALADGAREIDMVIPVGRALAGELDAVESAVRTVRTATEGAALKVILETGHFAVEALPDVAGAALGGGADFLKTSTGFGPRGASVEDVRLLRTIAPESVGVKAAGGIRDLAGAIAMLDAGANRLGTSRGVDLVAGKEGSGY